MFARVFTQLTPAEHNWKNESKKYIIASGSWRIIVVFGSRRRFIDNTWHITFNGDPEKLTQTVTNPDRVFALNPGEKFVLKK